MRSIKKKTSGLTVIVTVAVVCACVLIWVLIYTSLIEVKIHSEILKNVFSSVDKKIFVKQPDEKGLKTSPEFLDPNSPFFEMFYRDTYGTANTNNVDTSASTKENWKLYFPRLFKAIEKYNNGSFIRPLSNIVYYHPLVHIDRIDYTVGEEFQALIISRNPINGERKVYGGDYFRARLFTNTSKSKLVDGIPCNIFDNDDGSYKVTAPLLLTGTFQFDLQLVISLENIFKIVKKTENSKTWNYGYFATLKSGHEIFCDMHLSRMTGSEFCDYSNPRNQEPWYCREPPTGNCSNVIHYRYYGAGQGQGRTTLFRNPETEKPFRSKSPKVIFINVKISNILSEVEPKKLQICNSMFDKPSSPQQSITGYYKNNLWIPLHCRNPLVSTKHLSQCLNNKVIYVLGDSVIRQFIFFAQSYLNLDIKVADELKYWQKPKLVRNRIRGSFNVTMYYRAHGPPLQNPGPPSMLPYISDTVSNIKKGGKNVYILISIGLHLLNYDPSFYIHRLKKIKEAIIKHHEAFPETRVLIKGMNLCDYDFEWGVRRFDILLRRIFENMSNVLFLDIWSMTTVQPQEDHHPKRGVLHDQALLLFGHLCTEGISSDNDHYTRINNFY